MGSGHEWILLQDGGAGASACEFLSIVSPALPIPLGSLECISAAECLNYLSRSAARAAFISSDPPAS